MDKIIEQIAESLGNKIFAIETNVENLKRHIPVSWQEDVSGGSQVLIIVSEIESSLEKLKEIKQQLLDAR